MVLRRLAAVVGLALLIGCAATDQAAPGAHRAESARWPTLGLRAGAAVLASFDSDIGVESAPLNASASGSLEDTFSDNDRIGITRVDLFWRIDDDRRHRVDVNWFELTRSGDRLFESQVALGGQVLPAGSVVSSYLDTEVVKASYRFNFLVEDDWEAGISLGANAMAIDLGFTQGATTIEKSYPLTGPMPVLGLHAEWLPFDRIRALASAEAMYVKVDDVSGLLETQDVEGYLFDARIGVEWEPIDHLGVGVSYNFFRLDADYRESLVSASLKYDYEGVLVYGTLAF